MHPPKPPRHKCKCDVVATSAAKPDECMSCGGEFD